jgi:hypothetical protein
MIEEQEAPTAYQVKTRDSSGKEQIVSTPFQVGKRTYEGEYPQTPEEAFKPTFQPRDKPLTWDDAVKELRPILDEVERFLAPGIYRESPHPEMQEGEDYGQYCARIGREYEQATGANAIRRPVSDSDSVRESADVDPGGQRGASAPGAGDRQPGGPDTGGDAEPHDRSGAGDAGADNSHEWHPSNPPGEWDPWRFPSG